MYKVVHSARGGSVHIHEVRYDCAAVGLMEAEGQEVEMFELGMGHCLDGIKTTEGVDVVCGWRD